MSGMDSTAQFLERIGADGAKWAHEFKLTAEKLGHFGMDEGWLIGWFCNAISAGKDAAHRRASQAAPAPSEPVTLTYTNWQGKTAQRTINPVRVWFGSTPWHPEPQWLLTAVDAEKGLERDFALKDFGAPAPCDGLREAWLHGYETGFNHGKGDDGDGFEKGNGYEPFFEEFGEHFAHPDLAASPAQEGGEEAEQVGTCEACSKAIIDGEKYASTTDGCSLCFDCAPMLSDVARQMDEALLNGEAENWFDLSEDELRVDRDSIAADIAANGDRKAVS